MTQAWSEREAQIIEEVASSYEARGYSAERRPSLEEDGQGDLLARRSDDVVLVEVKRVPQGRADRVRLSTLAEHAARHGWRFSVVLVRETGFDEVEILDRDEVLRRLEDASRLDASSWIASIAAMAVFEAAARYALTRSGHASTPRPGPLECIQALASRGLVTPEDEDALRRLLRTRNAAAHGMTAEPTPGGAVAKALDIARSLVAPEPAAA